MERVRELFRKFQSTDGRIKALTATGVLALATVVAMAVGVLPALGEHDSSTIAWGGGDGACSSSLVNSDAAFELHINNPVDGFFEDPDTGARVELDVRDTANGQVFDFYFVDENDTHLEEGEGVFAASEVVVNGGKQSTLKIYIDPVTSGLNLHSPEKENGKDAGTYYNLSHVNICYDIAPVEFQCGVETPAIVLNDGFISGATVTVLLDPVANDEICPKTGVFYLDNTGDFTGAADPTVYLDFGDEGTEIPIRFDVIKDYGSVPAEDQLQYSLTLGGARTDMSVCNLDLQSAGPAGFDPSTAFDDVLLANQDGDPANDVYPTNVGVRDGLFNDGPDGLPGDAILCEVFDGSGADGFQKVTGFGVLVDPAMW